MDKTKDIIIGLECHVELNTKTKLFCSCPVSGSEEPNTRVCETCLGMPGSKPVLNKTAVEFALKVCIATKCKISNELVFSRKSYFYPDMSKNYQISQYEMPLGTDGKIDLSDGKKINISRIHLEEDPASLIHPSGMEKSSYCLIDYNRSGNPLLEIVTKPELESPEQARDFMKRLITILTYLEIFNENVNIIKADANISIKESGFVKTEIKNITGFKEIKEALEYEILRQKKEVKERNFKMETRAWNSDTKITIPLREKEEQEDYGYIIDTDLVKTEISSSCIQQIKKQMPELAHEKLKKFIQKFKINREDAFVLSQEKELANLFENVAEKINPDLAAKWLRRELLRVLNYNNKTISQVIIDEKSLIDLLSLIQQKKITDNVGSKILEKLIIGPFDVNEYIRRESLEAVSDKTELEKYCNETIKENPKAVEDYKNGELKSLNFIIGKVMQKTKGKATPKGVKEIILKLMEK